MIKTEIIKWARERANLTLEEANQKIASYRDWEEGKKQPTIAQLKKISEKLHIPLGYLYFAKPIKEELPVLDFRTIENKKSTRHSLELLETIYDAERKQDWLREQKIEDDEDEVITTTKRKLTAPQIIDKINTLLEIDDLRKERKDYEDFLTALIKKLDDSGFLVIRNGVVGYNNKRPLSIKEFKGFALFDEYAPLIFINGKDYKSSQIFTLIHELVHLFLHESALDGTYQLQTEQRCNKIAAEILLPEKSFEKRFYSLKSSNSFGRVVDEIAKEFNVSAFVVLIKAKQCGFISEETFYKEWKSREKYFAAKQSKEKGGDFYKSVKFKAGGNNFLLRVFHSTLAGQTLYRDAYLLTGLRGKTFDKYFKQQGLEI